MSQVAKCPKIPKSKYILVGKIYPSEQNVQILPNQNIFEWAKCPNTPEIVNYSLLPF